MHGLGLHDISLTFIEPISLLIRSVVLPQNNIFIFGGANTKKITNETYIFDISK